MRRLIAIAAVLIAAAGSAGAANQTRFTPAAASRIVLDGTSNVKDWSCSGTTLDGELTVAAPIDKINAIMDRIEDGNIGIWMSDPAAARFPAPAFTLQVPVASLRCGNAMMERDMNRAMRAEIHPTIEFRFTGLRGGVHHDIDANTYSVRVAGDLVLAGARRTVELTITASRLDANRFRIEAQLPLRMTDFGIAPPTALFGMVKARDELVVRFDMTLEVVS